MGASAAAKEREGAARMPAARAERWRKLRRVDNGESMEPVGLGFRRELQREQVRVLQLHPQANRLSGELAQIAALPGDGMLDEVALDRRAVAQRKARQCLAVGALEFGASR